MSFEYLFTKSILLWPKPYPIIYIAIIPYKVAAPLPNAIRESLLGDFFNNLLNPNYKKISINYNYW